MRDDGDFTAYAAARWPALVRTLVVLGSRPDVAQRLAHSALGQIRTDWRRRDDLGDLDVHTYRILLETKSRDRERWWLQENDNLVGGPLDLEWPTLEARLDRLPVGERRELVLRAVADLSDGQVAALVEHSAQAARDLLDPLRRVAESLPVSPLLVDELVTQSRADTRQSRRRTARTVLGLVVVLALVGGGGTWLANRPEPPPGLADASVKRADNPTALGWYTDNQLHLTSVTLGIQQLAKFAEIKGGAIYSDANGHLIRVDEEGQRTELGRQRRESEFAVDDADGLVAWIDVSGSPELVVYDLSAREVVGRADLEPDGSSIVLAIVDGLVYFTDGPLAYAYDVADDFVDEVEIPRLLDAAGETRVYQSDPQSIQMAHDGTAVTQYELGTGARLSLDGELVMTRTDDGRGSLGTLRIYETRTGIELDTGLPLRAQVFSFGFAADASTATYLVELAQPDPDDPPRLSNSGSLQLTTCSIPGPGESASCEVELTFPRSTAWALAQ